MKVKLISAQLTTGNIPEQRVPDRRYKRGYRVVSESQMTYLLRMRLSNPNNQFRIGENVRTHYGIFKVINVNKMVEGGEIQLLQHYSRLVGNEFEFNAEIDVMSAGYSVGEGSDCSQPKQP